ncbi:Transcription initiation factor TFIID subunit 13 [Dermatophagoides pteronyssinus]|uniref:Transcription initiation factor TFIID subunit 13 n=1 Tax=Dermatophagoides pteronyssinus TaxID=6956 RepID=A0ABQ8JUY3_DERPT|nr:Transcription initiation factor TFIID subunit 13 [Dermatophagoides pteronyssinus]
MASNNENLDKSLDNSNSESIGKTQNEQNFIDNKHSNVEKSSSSSQQQQQHTDKKKRLFSKELRCMMYGFGDDQNPYTETVDMLEDLVISFIGHIALEALEIGRTGRVTVEDVMYLVRRDQRKYARVKDLLSMNEELKRARKAFDEVEYVQKKKKLSNKMNTSGTSSNNSSSNNTFKSLGPLNTTCGQNSDKLI